MKNIQWIELKSIQWIEGITKLKNIIENNNSFSIISFLFIIFLRLFHLEIRMKKEHSSGYLKMIEITSRLFHTVQMIPVSRTVVRKGPNDKLIGFVCRICFTASVMCRYGFTWGHQQCFVYVFRTVGYCSFAVESAKYGFYCSLMGRDFLNIWEIGVMLWHQDTNLFFYYSEGSRRSIRGFVFLKRVYIWFLEEERKFEMI